MSDLTFQMLPWQRQVMDDPARFKVICAGRRCGKSRMAAVTLLIEGLKCPNGSGVMYVSPTQSQARVIIWSLLLEIGRDVIKSSHVNNSEITLANGAVIYVRGADRPDTLRGVSLSYAVLDEYADMKPSAWEEVIRASLSDRRGRAMFIGCVVKDTLILGENGLEEIGDSPIGYSSENKMVYGLGGFHKATDRYANDLMETVKIRTKAGIELEATPNHRIWTPNGWVRMDDLVLGSKTFMQYGQNVYGSDYCDSDFAYFLGLYLAEGNLERKIYRTCITSGDESVHEALSQFGFKRYDGFHSRLNSKEFMLRLQEWFPDAGAVKAPQKTLSRKVLGLNRESLLRFLAGYFDGDGTVASSASHGKPRQAVACTTSSEKLAKQLQALLLNMGYRASRSMCVTPPTKRVKVSSVGHRIEINGTSAYKFMQDVGPFMMDRKKLNAHEWVVGGGHQYWFERCDFGRLTKNDGYLKRCDKITESKLNDIDPTHKYDRQLLADEVVEVSRSFNRTFDFVIPDTHSYFSNGLVSHNTPKGRNHFYELFHQEDDEWKSWHFTTADNPLIHPDEIAAAKRTMSTFAFKSEYMASFDNSGTDTFKEEWLKYGTAPKGEYSTYIAVDLAGFEAVSKKNSSLDRTAIAVVFVTDEGKWFIRKIESGRFDVRETAVRILKNIRDFKPVGIGIEKGTTYNAVMPYLGDLMRKNNIFCHIQPLTHGNQNKNDRIIWALQGLFEHGRITLNRDIEWDVFIDEYLMFPTKNVHDDLIDALAMIAQMAVTTYQTGDMDDEVEVVSDICGF